MEHSVVDTRLNGYPAQMCSRCRGYTGVLVGLSWLYYRTPDGEYFVDQPCLEQKSVNEIMAEIYRSRDVKLYRKEKHKLNKHERLYLEDLLALL